MYISVYLSIYTHFTGNLAVKNLPVSEGDTGDTGSIHGSGRSHGEGNGNFHQSSREHPMDRSLVGYSPWGCTESDTTEYACTHLSTHTDPV